MKTKILLILLVSILFLYSCGPRQVTKMTAIPSSDQKTGYDGTITSQKKHFVSLSPYSDLEYAKDKTIFMLGVQNCGEGPIDIGYDKISVIFREDKGNGASKRINVQPFDDFMNDLKEEYGNKVKKYMVSALESIKVDSEYGGSVSSDSSSMGDKMEDLRLRLESMRLRYELLQEGLPEYDMKLQTIMPGESHNGIVVCDTRDMAAETEGDFHVQVSIDGEEYRFIFNRTMYN